MGLEISIKVKLKKITIQEILKLDDWYMCQREIKLDLDPVKNLKNS